MENVKVYRSYCNNAGEIIALTGFSKEHTLLDIYIFGIANKCFCKRHYSGYKLIAGFKFGESEIIEQINMAISVYQGKLEENGEAVDVNELKWKNSSENCISKLIHDHRNNLLYLTQKTRCKELKEKVQKVLSKSLQK